jgi:DNA invertase Pin-like site-specific DNA recombinase
MSNLVPAAQYLRMSTEHQQYSMQNQAAAIQRYAEIQAFDIVRFSWPTEISGTISG